MLGCPYESLAKRSLLSSSPLRDGDAAVGAKASRVCFFWDLRGIVNEAKPNQRGNQVQASVMANAKANG